ncbi:SDR family NAD(P)-dependent oxidoreductase [Castellaniella defragrans]|uniref:NAD(P)-dependent dehydrogenase (Short-subunit alcohol dehydrogenase family) n=1 Tax=Castellaniella defragrans TaxID=75697 RepID=A0A7W9TLC8_CASDE|nr:SDR family oxidoreductase [Castellaniella defragrans]KAB0623052.1 SDR family oxidoreductase [Castellaniella defragrans]MBB6082825.1 NAD(P)-dependent dehydrogenase (short-subunit alcohol dehydrogenase family) [Castellaniella defragrans]
MQTATPRIALITGGGAGIGLAAARAFAAAGTRAVITGRNEARLAAVARQTPGIDYIVADAASAADAERTIATTLRRWGRLDVLVNNAGAGALLPLAQADAERIAAIFATNVVGPSLLARAALPHLKASAGAIVNVSSTFGHKAAAGLSHYAASKAALEHMTRCWALELAADGIRVNAVAAGPTETRFLQERMQLTPARIEAVKAEERARIPLGRRGEPEDIAPWIVSLAAPGAAWITGQVLCVDGGLDVT